MQAFSARSFTELAAGAGLRVTKIRFSAHPLLTFVDVGYYVWLDLRGGSSRSLDDSLAEGTGLAAAIGRSLRAAVASVGWFESRLLGRLPGTCGHFTCRLN